MADKARVGMSHSRCSGRRSLSCLQARVPRDRKPGDGDSLLTLRGSAAKGPPHLSLGPCITCAVG